MQLRVLLGNLLVLKCLVGQEIDLNLQVELACNALVDTVDGEPARALLTTLLEHDWIEIHLHEAQTGLHGLAHLADFNLQGAGLRRLIFKDHLEGKEGFA